MVGKKTIGGARLLHIVGKMMITHKFGGRPFKVLRSHYYEALLAPWWISGWYLYYYPNQIGRVYHRVMHSILPVLFSESIKPGYHYPIGSGHIFWLMDVDEWPTFLAYLLMTISG